MRHLIEWMAHRWHNLSLRRKGLIVVSIPFVSMTVGILIVFTLQRLHLASEELLIRSYNIRGYSRVLLRAASDAETAVQGFALTRDDTFLTAYRTAAAQIRPALAQLSGTAGLDPSHQATLREVEQLVDQLQSQYAETIDYLTGAGVQRTTGGIVEMVRNQRAAMDEVRSVLLRLESEQNLKLGKYLAEQERFRRWFTIAAPAGWGLAMVSIFSAAWLFLTGTLRRLRELEVLYTVDGPLIAPPSGADEISRLGQALFEAKARLSAREQALRSAQVAASVAREQAEAANRAKSDFLSRMSHELRTPLNAILGFTQLLQMGSLTEDQRESTNQVLKAGKHLLGLINEVLDIARIESGKLALSLEPVNVAVVLDQTLDMMRISAQQRSIAVEISLTNRALCVMADNQRLKQVVLNLLSNAIKYNHIGGRVLVSAYHSRDSWVRIEVTDTGMGIPEDKLERLFVPFDRLGAEATEIEGAGIGLALSRSMTEAMGGRMGVSSRVSQGSTFWLELPCAEVPSASEEPDPVPEADPPAPIQGRKLVLCIEDNMSNYTLLERAFRSLPGIELLGALQATVGLELARTKLPDLILLDLHLPDMHGGEALLELKADPITAAIPVIILSADATPSEVTRLKSQGAVDYLTKPLDLNRFLRTVQTQLEVRGDPDGSERRA